MVIGVESGIEAVMKSEGAHETRFQVSGSRFDLKVNTQSVGKRKE